MKPSTKAAFLSALVFPGIGHLFLKRFKTGAAIIIATIGLIGVLMYAAMSVLNKIYSRLEKDILSLDYNQIINIVTQAMEGNIIFIFNTAIWLITLLWIGSIIDSYRIGRMNVVSNPC